MNRINVSELRPKQDITSVFVLKYLAIMSAKDGKKYLNVILSDATGDLESRVWTNAEDIYQKFDKGQFVQVQGKVNMFQGRKQFIIQEMELVDPKDVNEADYVASSEFDSEQMYQELTAIVTNLEDIYIKELLTHILNDSEIARRLKKWQAGKTIHHAYQGGLLEHILSCANLAVQLSPIYKVNTSYVVAGAILHDLCKIYELTDDINVEYTEEGKLVGHLVKGLEIIDRFSYKMNDFPYQMKLHLKHILLSHHGEYAYGSPKIPQTSEAMLVHMIDLMDSKMHTFKAIKKSDNNTGHWSSYVGHMDRIIFKEELPTFTEYQNSSDKKVDSPKNKKANNELTHSLGDALKNFKV